MFRIACPYCGPREESEFDCGGEAHISRPLDPSSLTDDQWADYVFMRKNPKGLHAERWVHAGGCRRWFHVVRNTQTHAIKAVYGIDTMPPLDLD